MFSREQIEAAKAPCYEWRQYGRYSALWDAQENVEALQRDGFAAYAQREFAGWLVLFRDRPLTPAVG